MEKRKGYEFKQYTGTGRLIYKIMNMYYVITLENNIPQSIEEYCEVKQDA